MRKQFIISAKSPGALAGAELYDASDMIRYYIAAFIIAMKSSKR